MKKNYYYVFTLFLTMLVSTSVFAQTNYYVSKATGGDTKSGLSWSEAFKSIDKVLDMIGNDTDNGQTYNVYLAQGEYSPGNRTFSGNKHIKFYGGYPIPGTDTPDDYICVQAPTVFSVKFIHSGSGDLFRINNTTALSFDGITYQHAGRNNRFIYVSSNANQVNVTLENMIIPSYQANTAFIYFQQAVNSSFTAKNIYVSGAAGNRRFLYVNNGSNSNNINVTVSNSTFKDNTSGNNNPLFDLYFQNIDRNGKATFTGNTFFGNGNTNTSGSCIKVNQGKEIKLDNNIISENFCNEGVVRIENSESLDVRNSSFCSNKGQIGVALSINENVTTHTSHNNYFSGNEASERGAVIDSKSPIASTNDQFYGNISTQRGGAIMFHTDKPRSFDACVFKGNKADEGGAIYSYDMRTNKLEVSNSFFIENEVTSNSDVDGGGALYLYGSNYESKNNTYKGNKSPNANGGAIMSRSGGINITLEGDTFIGNTVAKRGGSIFLQSINTLKVDGTTFMDNECNGLNIEGGGAISVFNITELLLGESTPNTFIRNYTKSNGGAICLRGSGTITDNASVYYENHADDNGGAVYIEVGGTFTNSSFLQNYVAAGKKGGAIYGTSPISFIDSKSYNNSINQTDYTTPNAAEFFMSGSNKMTIDGVSKVQLEPNATNYPTNNYILGTDVTQSTSFSSPSDVVAATLPDVNGTCPSAPTIEETLKPTAFITVGETVDPLALVGEKAICRDEASMTKSTIFSVTGKAPFTFVYRRIAINGETLTPTTEDFSVTTTTEKQITLNLPTSIPEKGITYRYEVVSVKADNSDLVLYECDPAPQVSISIHPKPQIVATVLPVKICEGSEFQLSCSFIPTTTLTEEMTSDGGQWINSTAVTSWSWSGPNGFISREQNPTISEATPDMSGEYILTITDNNGCTSKDTIDVTVNKCKALWLGQTDTDWEKAENWKDGYVPLEGDEIKFATADNNGGNPAVNDLQVPGTSTDPTTIGKLTNASDKSLIVPAGSSIIVTGDIDISGTEAEKENKIIIKADTRTQEEISAAGDTRKPNGSFIATGHDCNVPVYATVEFYSRAYKGAPKIWPDNIPGSPTIGHKFEASYHWQHFGVPVKAVKADPTFYKSYLREYHEDSNGDETKFYQKWTDLDNSSLLKAFKGYEITQEEATTYQIAGELQTCNQELTMTRKAPAVTGATGDNKHYGLGQNIFGNSYTTAIDINKIVFPREVEPTVYLYNTGSFVKWGDQTASQTNNGTQVAGQYTSIPQNASTAVYDGRIPSMNGFLLKFTDGETTFEGSDVEVTLNYKDVAVNNTQPQTAPKAPLSYLEIELASKSTVDRLWLFSQEGTTEGFDNGWDGRKFFGTPTAFIYSETPAGNMQVNTTETLENKVITFYANGDKEYTLFINKKGLENYDNLTLLDLETKKVIALKDEQTVYHFTAKTPNLASKRFKIVNTETITDDMLKNTTGIAIHQQAGNKINVYNYTKENGKVQVFDVSGRLVLSQEMKVGNNDYTLNLERGTYFVFGFTKTSNGRLKFVLKK